MTSIYSHLPNVVVPTVSAVRYNWDHARRADKGTEIYLGKAFGSYQNPNRNDQVSIGCCMSDSSTGRFQDERWTDKTVSCKSALETTLAELPQALGTSLISPFVKWVTDFCVSYNQGIEKAVEKVLGKRQAELFQGNHLQYGIGAVSVVSDSASKELKELDRQGALFIGTEEPLVPEYAFNFGAQRTLKIHGAFLEKLAEREGVEGPCASALAQDDFSTKELDYDAFKALVTYIYTGKIECDARTLPKLEALAKQLELPKLEKKVAELNACKGQHLLDLIQGEEGTEKKLFSLKERLIAPFGKEEDPALAFRKRLETLLPEFEEVTTLIDRQTGREASLKLALDLGVNYCVSVGLKEIGKNFAAHNAASYTLLGWKGAYALPAPNSRGEGKVIVKPDQKGNEIDKQGRALFGSTLLKPDMVWEVDGIAINIHSEFCKKALLQREGEECPTNLFASKVTTSLRGAKGEELVQAESDLERTLVSEEVVNALVGYIYKGEIETSVKNLPGLYYLADALSLPNLKKALSDAMRKNPESTKVGLERAIAAEQNLAKTDVRVFSGDTVTEKTKRIFEATLEPMLRIQKNIAMPLLAQFSSV